MDIAWGLLELWASHDVLQGWEKRLNELIQRLSILLELIFKCLGHRLESLEPADLEPLLVGLKALQNGLVGVRGPPACVLEVRDRVDDTLNTRHDNLVLIFG